LEWTFLVDCGGEFFVYKKVAAKS